MANNLFDDFKNKIPFNLDNNGIYFRLVDTEFPYYEHSVNNNAYDGTFNIGDVYITSEISNVNQGAISTYNFNMICTSNEENKLLLVMAIPTEIGVETFETYNGTGNPDRTAVSGYSFQIAKCTHKQSSGFPPIVPPFDYYSYTNIETPFTDTTQDDRPKTIGAIGVLLNTKYKTSPSTGVNVSAILIIRKMRYLFVRIA